MTGKVIYKPDIEDMYEALVWLSEYSANMTAFRHTGQTGNALWNWRGSRRVRPEQPGSSQTIQPQ